MSNINPAYPQRGNALTQNVRDNFQAAADEIDANVAAIAQETSDREAADLVLQGQIDSNDIDIATNAANISDNADAIAVIEAIPPFNDYLAGYLDTGVHAQYAGDLDVIAANSTYNIASTGATNLPTDYSQTGRGFITTYLQDATRRTQVIYGRGSTNVYRISVSYTHLTLPTSDLV